MKFKIDWIKTSQIIAIIFGILGILVLVVYVILIGLQGYYSGNVIILENFARFGDFIGGLVGSLWAFAGVLLFYVALVYQRRELEDTKIAQAEQLRIANENLLEINFNHHQSLHFNLLNEFSKVRTYLNTPDQHNGNLIPISFIIESIEGIIDEITMGDIIINEGLVLESIFTKYRSNYFLFGETFFSIVLNCRGNLDANHFKGISYESTVVNTLSDEEILLVLVYGLFTGSNAYSFYFTESHVWRLRLQNFNRLESPTLINKFNEILKGLELG